LRWKHGTARVLDLLRISGVSMTYISSFSVSTGAFLALILSVRGMRVRVGPDVLHSAAALSSLSCAPLELGADVSLCHISTGGGGFAEDVGSALPCCGAPKAGACG